MNELNRIAIRAATIAVTGLILSVGQSVLANGFGNDNQGCAVDLLLMSYPIGFIHSKSRVATPMFWLDQHVLHGLNSLLLPNSKE